MSRKQRMAEKFNRLQTRSAATLAPAQPARASASESEHDGITQRDLTVATLSIRAASINEQARTVEAVLATENPVTVFDMHSYRVIEEVLIAGGAELPSGGQMPLLADHNRWSIDAVRGSIRSMRIENGRVIGVLHFADDPDSERAWQKVRQGHITDVSVGYRSTKFIDIPAGQTQTVDGRTYTASERVLRIAQRWQPKEGSLTPIGADPQAKIRDDSGGVPPSSVTPPPNKTPGRTVPGAESTVMNPKLRKYLESIGLRSDATDEQAAAFQATLTGHRSQIASLLENRNGLPQETQRSMLGILNFDWETGAERAATTEPAGTTAPTQPAAVDVSAVRAEAERAERTRLSEIERLCSTNNVPADLRSRMLFGGTSEAGQPIAPLDVNQARAAILDHISGSRQAPAGIVRNEPDPASARHMLATSLMLRAGLPHTRIPVPSSTPQAQRDTYRERMANDADGRYRDISLLDVCRESLRLDGHHISMSRSETIELMQRTASTGSLTNIFTTSMNAMLLMAFEAYPDTTQQWTSQVEVADFKTNDRILPGKGTTMAKLGRGGTARDMIYSDSKESYKIARYAGKNTVDEQDVIDDNLGFIQQIPADMGEEAAQIRPRMVYAILLANAALGADSVALFHSSHSNTATNTLSIANLAAGIAAMAKQTQNGRNLNLRPAFLIVPHDLWADALEFIKSPTIVIAGTAGSVTTKGITNVIAGENITVVMDNSIGVAGVTDPVTGTAYAGTATNWFLAADPRRGKTIEVGVLRGTGGRPQLRSYVLDKGQWGIGWDCKLDIGAAPLAYQGLYRGNT